MRRKASVSIILAIFLLTVITPSLAQNNINSATIHSKAVQYLVDNYNSTVGLIPETNGSNTYWLVSDNLLAFYALRNDNATVSNEIASELKNEGTQLVHDSKGFPISYKHEAVIGDVLPEVNNQITFENAINYPLINSTRGWSIVTEIDDNGSDPINESVSHYADLFGYRGLSYFNSNNPSEARVQYSEMMNQFWKGYGFVDDAFSNTTKEYSTYKLGLALTLANKLDISDSNTTEMLNIIEQCQDSQSGGIHTGYEVTNGVVSYSGQTNTETTSIIAIATENNSVTTPSNSPSVTSTTAPKTPSQTPNPINKQGVLTLVYVIIAVIVIGLLIVAVAFLAKPKVAKTDKT